MIARFVHHTWMMDVTEIRSFLGLQVFHLAGVFDAFSRVPLALSHLGQARRDAARHGATSDARPPGSSPPRST